MLTYSINKFDEYLNNKGIDTVCFMGYGYKIEEVKVGATFYIPYAYYTKDSDYNRSDKEDKFKDTLENCIKHFNLTDDKLLDTYKLMSKYKYFTNILYGHKDRREYVIIKNLRTKEIIILKDDDVDHFQFFNFITW